MVTEVELLKERLADAKAAHANSSAAEAAACGDATALRQVRPVCWLPRAGLLSLSAPSRCLPCLLLTSCSLLPGHACHYPGMGAAACCPFCS